MSRRILCDIPLNRVEGDLEIRVELENGRVVDAWSAGTMFRGFENLMVGRGALDGLVITPRICGICSTTHLMAAAQALDAIAGVTPPPNALRLRNLSLMTEHCQSDVRQSLLMFLPDFANSHYAAHPLHAEAVARHAPLAGRRAIDAVRQTRQLLEVIAILGGQWPHSAHMVPGGVAYIPPLAELNQCRYLLHGFRQWYEQTVLGCPVERWQAVQSAADLAAWLEAAPAHREADLGFLLRFGRMAGLHEHGRGHGHFITHDALAIPPASAVSGSHLITGGFLHADGRRFPLDQGEIAEHVAASWYEDHPGGKHPYEGETRPVPPESEGRKYSWSKAARYQGLPAETGPLAERLIAGDALFTDLVRQEGVNLLTRQLARLARPAMLLPVMQTWLDEMIAQPEEGYYTPVGPIRNGRGFGLIQAARGALGHWVDIREGRIIRYQIITPTAWNGSPRDADGVRGPWEEALIGTPIADIENPVEAGHVVRSFDPCLVCTVHVVGGRHLPLAC